MAGTPRTPVSFQSVSPRGTRPGACLGRNVGLITRPNSAASNRSAGSRIAQGAVLICCCLTLRAFAQSPSDRQTVSSAATAVTGAEREVARRNKQPAGTTAPQAGELTPLRQGAPPIARADWLWPLVLLALIGAVALLLRRRAGAGITTSSGGGMELLSRLPLSTRQSVMLVRMGHGVLVLGVGADRITTLAHVTDSLEAVELIAAARQSRPGSLSNQFGEFLKSAAATFAPRSTEERASERTGPVAGAAVRLRGDGAARRGSHLDAAA